MRSQPCSFLCPALLACAAVAAFAGPLAAQPQQAPAYPSPRLLIVSPASVQQGNSVELSLYVADVEAPSTLLFSFPGAVVERLEAPPPLKPDPKKPAKPAPPPPLRCRVTIPSHVEPGIYDVRVVAKNGVTNPRAFVVGDLPEILEREGNDDVPQAQRVPLNSTVNGDVNSATDVDYFLFEGKKGQRVLASCLTTSIDSRLQPALEIYRKGGGLLTQNRDYQGNDALADVVLPADGEYYVRLHGFAFTPADREHFYRLTISTTPWIDAVFPSILEPGKPNKVTVYGRNLPNGVPAEKTLDGVQLEKMSAVIDAPKDPADALTSRAPLFVPPRASGMDLFAWRLQNGSGYSNNYPLYLSQAPVVLAAGVNHSKPTAQAIASPCEVAGVLLHRGQRDWYVFTAKRGETLSMELYGDRISAEMDLYAQVRDFNDKLLTELDDNVEAPVSNHFYARTEDPSRYRFVAPADGQYFIIVSSREVMAAAGRRYQYRLRLTEERPDFRVVLVPQNTNDPEACNLGQGGSQYFVAYVWRQDGFEGTIHLSAEGLPKGVTCPPQAIGPSQRVGSLVFTAAADAPAWAGAVRVTAAATVQGRKIVREVRAASLTWPLPFQQPNVPRISRLDRQIVLGVSEQKPLFTLEAKGEPAPVLQGGRVTIPLRLSRGAETKNPVAVFALNPPSSVGGPKPNPNQPQLTLSPGQDSGNVTLDISSNTPPGVYTLVFRGVTQVPSGRTMMGKPQNFQVVYPSTPVTITVLPKQLADITLSTGNLVLRPGKEAELTVRIKRLFNYQGEFQIELVSPQGTKDITAAAVTLRADAEEIKLALKASPDATPGNRTGFVVRATALFEGKTPITQEAKLTVNVQK